MLAIAALWVAPAFSQAINEQDAARFLTQATFGPTPAEIAKVKAMGYSAWIDDQLSQPLPALGHQAYWDQRNAALVPLKSHATTNEVTASFWRMAVTGGDQLRQRLAFALSEIFVVSLADNCGDNLGARSVASYLDMLDAMAFSRYRELLEHIALHPAMGCYLSHLHNEKEDLDSGRVPDENFAREVMQLFSIGLYELNPDGTRQLNAAGQPIETYQARDVSELAKVFTGFSWDCPQPRNEGCFLKGINGVTGRSYEDRNVMAMVPYPQYHSTSAKHFLGVTIAAQSSPNPQESLRMALDTLASHHNTAPFISKQLIQRLVTANPSPAYVARVAKVFLDQGGNLGATVKAILLDPEARDSRVAKASQTFGKVREPILRVTALLRAFGGLSMSGDYLMRPTDDPGFGLAQSPMKSPSVFNFFRPGYVPPGTAAAEAGLVNPEMQIATAVSAAGYVNFMRGLIEVGAGWNGLDQKTGPVDVQFGFNQHPDDPLLLLTDSPERLMDVINARLFYGWMSTGLRAKILEAVTSIDFHPEDEKERLAMRRHRLWSALLLAVASPEYLIQR
ncbi:MAG: DUF1800 domain-containing protein [Burkholderiales bacterium]|nr:DUF1800 domain-containing protein [Burkholderiales bacterium]MDE2433743.1 DUF1800 domain-containing protein [Burkholderiales bacterium]